MARDKKLSRFVPGIRRGVKIDGEADVTAGTIGTAELADSAVTNAKQAVPKIVVYQETITRAAMTDGGATAGTIALSTTIPAGAVFLKSTIHSITGFAGDTTAVITIGDGTDVDRYNTGTPDVFSTVAAGVDMGAPSGTAFHSAAKTPTVTITSTADFTNVSAGAATITLFYYRPV